MMYGISQFMLPRGLRIFAKYRHPAPALTSHTNKILAHCNSNESSEKNRRYSNQINNKCEVKSLYIINPTQLTLRNVSSSSVNVTQSHRKRRSKKWIYVLGLGGLLGGMFVFYTSEDDDDEFTNSGLRAPCKPSEITKAWIENMLTEYERQNNKVANVIVKSFELNNAISPGQGLNSQLLKLDVLASIENLLGMGLTSLDKEYHVMIKMRVQGKAVIQEMNKFVGSELKELTLYSEVIPELNRFQESFGNEFQIKVPDFLYGKCTNKESVLVIENIKPAGYKPHSIKCESDLNHAKVVVENLAKLHAVSYSYNKSHNFLDKFPCYKGEGVMNWFHSYMNASVMLANAIKLLELKNDKELTKLKVKIENSKSMLDKKFKDIVRDDSSKVVLCLTHGDCHNGNLLFRYGEDGDGNQTIDDLQVVDWQLANWNSPIMDLQYFLTICTTQKFRKAHLETLLEHYHSMFTQATTKMGTPVSNWTYEEFKKEYDRFAVFGLIRGLMVVQFTFSKYSKVIQGDLLEESSHANPRIEKMNSKLCKHLWHKLYTSPNFEKIMMSLNSLIMYDIGKEIVNGTNSLLNDRILELVLDADEQGLFNDNE